MSTTHWTEGEIQTLIIYCFIEIKSDTPSRKVLGIVCFALKTRKVDGEKLNLSALTFSQSSLERSRIKI